MCLTQASMTSLLKKWKQILTNFQLTAWSKQKKNNAEKQRVQKVHCKKKLFRELMEDLLEAVQLAK